MKKTDIAMLILIAALSVGAAYLVVGAVPFLKPPEKPVSVPTVERYSADVQEPDKAVFYPEALNPTVPVTIGPKQ